MLRSSFNTLWEMEPSPWISNRKSDKGFNTLWEMEPKMSTPKNKEIRVSIPYGKWNLVPCAVVVIALIVSIPYGKWNPFDHFHSHNGDNCFNTLWEMEPLCAALAVALVVFQYPMGNGTVISMKTSLNVFVFQYPMGNGTGPGKIFMGTM